MNKKENNWNKIYEKEFAGTWYPSDSIIKFSARYLKRKLGLNKWEVKKSVNRILDAGCGVGRHVMFFQEQAIDAYGIDISEDAIKIGNESLRRKELKQSLQTADITSLPFEDEYFDVIVSHEILDHISYVNAKKAIEEIKRVCSKGGYIYISLRSVDDSEFGRGKKVDHNTFVLEEGYEKGLIQHYFELDEISELLKGLKVFDISLYEEKFPKEYGIDKAYFQSSQSLKKYFELSNALNLNLKYSRWHIVAEKV